MHKLEKNQIDVSKLSTVVGGWPKGNHDEILRQLNILGMRDVQIADSFEETRNSISKDEADIFLVNVNGAGSTARSIMKDIRNQEIGKNPFMVMVSIIQPKDEAEVAETIDSGPDDLLMSPFRRDVFIDRIKEIGQNRKKFVATASFVGPTRRTSTRPGRASAPEFEVPNPVRSLGTGVPRETFWEEIEAAAISLSSRKVNSDIQMIKSLIEEIVPDYKDSNIGEDFRRRIELLRSSIDALHSRSMKFGYVNVANLCDMAGNIITDIGERTVPPNLRHFTVLPKLMQGFQAALLTWEAPTGTA